MLTRGELDTIFHPLPRLETERFLLEPVRVAHADALFLIFSDAAVMSAGAEETHASIEITTTHIGSALKRHEARTGISWALVLRNEDRAVGHLSLHSISWPNRRADLGFDLAPRLWRQGLMSEALRAVIQFCFSELRFIKLCAQNTIYNERCHGLLLSLGFHQEAVLLHHGFWNGRAHDLRQYGLLAPTQVSSNPPNTT